MLSFPKKSPVSQDKTYRGGVILVLLITTLIYLPSLWHTARSDHIVYLAQFAETNDFTDLTLGAYDLNRTMAVAAYRDEELFRPLVYVVLGMEKWLFGYHFWLWQLVGILGHLGVVYLLYRVLQILAGKKPALAATFFFATMFAGMEMVIWQHINSYLFFIACLLGIILNLLQRASLRPVRKTLFLLFLACLFYEMGFFFALILFGVSFISGKSASERKQSFGWLGPPLLYLSLNILNLAANRIPLSVLTAKDSSGGIFHNFKQIFLSFSWWGYSAIFPTELRINILQRTVFFPIDLFEPKTLFSFRSIMDGVSNLSGLIVFCSFLVLLLLSVRQPRRGNRPVLAVVGIFLLCYTGVLVLGRMNSRSLEYILKNNSYNTYFFWIFFLILGCGLVNFKKFSGKATRFLHVAFLAMLTSALINGLLVMSLNIRKAREDHPRLALTQAINRLVSQNKKNADFSFGFKKSAAWLNPYYPFKSPHRPQQGVKTYCELLYPQYYDPDQPMYVLGLKGGQILAEKKIGTHP